MNKLQLQNTVVIVAALGATLVSVYSNTNWLSPGYRMGERERCYGVAKLGKNDCGNASHTCAARATMNSDIEEFVMVPKGLCKRIVGGKGA